MASYADVAGRNTQQWDVNKKKIGVIEKLVKNSKQIRRGIQLYFFGQWKKYAKQRYLKLGFRGFKKNWKAYYKLAKIFIRRDLNYGYDSQDDDAYEIERKWIPQCFGNHGLNEECHHGLINYNHQSFYYEGPKCAHEVAIRIQKIWRRHKAYKVANTSKEVVNNDKWYAMRPEYHCYRVAREILVSNFLTEDVWSVIEGFINFKEWKEEWLRRYYVWEYGSAWNPNNRMLYNRLIWLKKSTDDSDSIWFPNKKESISAKSILKKGTNGCYVVVAKQLDLLGLQMKVFQLFQYCHSTVFWGKLVTKIVLSKCSCSTYPFTCTNENNCTKPIIHHFDGEEKNFIDLRNKIVLKIGYFRPYNPNPIIVFLRMNWKKLKSEDGIYPYVAQQVKTGATAFFTNSGLYSRYYYPDEAPRHGQWSMDTWTRMENEIGYRRFSLSRVETDHLCVCVDKKKGLPKSFGTCKEMKYLKKHTFFIQES